MKESKVYVLRLYRNRDRKLLFDGLSNDPKVQLLPPKEVVLNGKRWRVVNQGSQPGELGLWLSESA